MYPTVPEFSLLLWLTPASPMPIIGSHSESVHTLTKYLTYWSPHNCCSIVLYKHLDFTTQHKWEKYRVKTFKSSFLTHKKITRLVLVRFQRHSHTYGDLHSLFIFFVYLFNNAVSNSDYTLSNELLMVYNLNEHQRKWS